MNNTASTHVQKQPEKAVQSAANTMQAKRTVPGFSDNRPGAALQAQQIRMIQRKCESCGEEEEPVQLMSAGGNAVIQMACAETDHDTSLEHVAIENDYKANVAAAAKEYEIPEGSISKNADGSNKTGYADLVEGKAIFDIKRHDEGPPIAQLDQYVLKANEHCGGGFTKGARAVNRTIDFNAENRISYWKDMQNGVISYHKVPVAPQGVPHIGSFFRPAAAPALAAVPAAVKHMPAMGGFMHMGGGGGGGGGVDVMGALMAPMAFGPAVMSGGASGASAASSGFSFGSAIGGSGAGAGGFGGAKGFAGGPSSGKAAPSKQPEPAPAPLAEWSRSEVIDALAMGTISQAQVWIWIVAQHDIAPAERNNELADILRAADRRG